MLRWLFILLCLSVDTVADTSVLVYPFQLISDSYPKELLQLAINKDKTEQQYSLQEARVHAPQGRSLLLISQGQGIDIAWSMTSNEREALLTAIKIPLYKGLYGYRLFLIHNTQQNRFPAAMALEDLQNNRLAVQGVDWPDIKILQHNEFNVISAKRFSAMFELVSKQRVDYFPRSILEIWQEQKTIGQETLAVEQNLALFYPTYVYYFVAKDNHSLAQRLRTGLLQSIEDGSFDELFNRYKGEALENANMKNRQVFPLDNPNVNQDGVYQWPSVSNE